MNFPTHKINCGNKIGCAALTNPKGDRRPPAPKIRRQLAQASKMSDRSRVNVHLLFNTNERRRHIGVYLRECPLKRKQKGWPANRANAPKIYKLPDSPTIRSIYSGRRNERTKTGVHMLTRTPLIQALA